jgi:uncharacterized lipoprotein YajG
VLRLIPLAAALLLAGCATPPIRHALPSALADAV